MFSKMAKKVMKPSPSIWRYVVNLKSKVKMSSIFVAFLENMNFSLVFTQKFVDNAQQFFALTSQ